MNSCMQKHKTGYLPGVFDLFHVGHLNILRRAKEQCEYLIVGINSDELVKEYKQKTTIIPFEERIQIVQAIKYVDEVFLKETLDIHIIMSRIKFDVMFAGDDWKNSIRYLQYEKVLKEIGVEIVYLPYTYGTSSTLITKILNEAVFMYE